MCYQNVRFFAAYEFFRKKAISPKNSYFLYMKVFVTKKFMCEKYEFFGEKIFLQKNSYVEKKKSEKETEFGIQCISNTVIQ